MVNRTVALIIFCLMVVGRGSWVVGVGVGVGKSRGCG